MLAEGPGRSPALPFLGVGVQEVGHLVQVEAQVLARAPTRSHAWPQERTGGGFPVSTHGWQMVAQNTPTSVW